MRCRAALLGLLIAAVSGCAGGEGGPAFTERDSAGVTIVENVQGSWSESESWRLSAEPVLDIGVLEGEDEYQLFQVGGATLLDDGRIVVANGGTGELRYYDRDGGFLKAAGRKGEGPGEFESMGSPVLVGDSIFVWDFRLRRMSVLSREGEFGSGFRVHAALTVPAGTFSDGSSLFTAGFSFRPSEIAAVVRDTALYGHVSREGDLLDSIGRFPSIEFYVLGTDQRAAASSLPFGRRTYAAVHGQTAYLGSSDSYEILRYAADGRLEGIVRVAHEPLPVTQEDIEREKADRMEGADGNWRRTLERMFAEMPIPSTMPAFDGLETDRLGNLWVRETVRPGATDAVWTVFDSEGRIRGTAWTPADLSVAEIGVDYLLGTWRDELDVEHVQLYELIKPGE
jgi:hypothetical protein